MAETTEEFMARFRATGLDMLCEARRRAEQALPWHYRYSGTVTGRLSGRSIWKSGSVGKSFFDMETYERNTWKNPNFCAAYDHKFIDLDLSELERKVVLNYLDPRLMHGSALDVEPSRERSLIAGRRVGQSFHKLSTALALAAATLSTFDGWHDMFHESDPEQHNLPERILWPGVKAQVEGERRLNPKRIAKDRMKKKLAKKRK